MAYREDPEQEAVLAGDEEHIVVIAPPGTGKTALAARLAARDAAHLEDHQRILVLTFSNQARGQLEREASRTLLRGERRRIVVSNYHSFFWSAVRSHRRALGLPEDVRISSWRRRQAILRGADQGAVEQLQRQRYLLETFAEQEHSDIAVPTGLDPSSVERLLAAVKDEHSRGNLIFDDLGAMFWTLLSRFPSLRAALRERFPIVVADEHQDASLLQDALVREVGRSRRVILADPMQLIHGWRGADERRLQAHRDECQQEYTLATPHRWHGDPASGAWLLAVRNRLSGQPAEHPAPAGARVVLTDPSHGDNGMLAATRYEVFEAMRRGCASVAILARAGDDVIRVRNHLTSHGLRPRQLGATELFEKGLALAEDLPGLDERGLVDRAVEVVTAFLPTLPPGVVAQVGRRLGPTGSRKAGCGGEARAILEAMDAIYLNGAQSFFSSVVSACEALIATGHHLPRPDEFAVYAAAGRAAGRDGDEQLGVFNRELASMSRRSHQTEAGVMTMTVHQAKGREFDAIVLYAASARWFGESAEDRRTFYVAITRGVRRWGVIAPRGRESPLVAALGVR